VPLGRHTSLRVGGPARLFLAGDDPQALARALDAAVEEGLPILVLGGGSNLLVADSGFDGLVLKLTSSGYAVETDEAGAPVVRAAAGALLGNLARRLAREGLGGLEWAATVPGAVGGAVVNNAGAFGGCLADNLLDVDLIQVGRSSRTLRNEELGYAYRTSVLKRGELGSVLVTSARLRVHRTTARKALTRIAQQQEQRTASQPRQLSAGSIFANPPGDYAGRLIEAAGLKGERRGGAEISAQHANFIVNTGGATASNVYSLIRQAQTSVWERVGVWLHPEVQLVGGWAPEQVAALAGPAGATSR
jgi:UDP-N-acetylmuramate dehydrogenase